MLMMIWLRVIARSVSYQFVTFGRFWATDVPCGRNHMILSHQCFNCGRIFFVSWILQTHLTEIEMWLFLVHIFHFMSFSYIKCSFYVNWQSCALFYYSTSVLYRLLYYHFTIWSFLFCWLMVWIIEIIQ